ncbi:MAG TPA: hypothetical protein VEV41_19385 [Terriglobales bacterium]|nr:hypothetical protein [Terriglobales bacterium]
MASRPALAEAGSAGDSGAGLGVVPGRYFDLNVRYFHEKLGEEHGIQLSYTWVKQALQGADW